MHMYFFTPETIYIHLLFLIGGMAKTNWFFLFFYIQLYTHTNRQKKLFISLFVILLFNNISNIRLIKHLLLLPTGLLPEDINNEKSWW